MSRAKIFKPVGDPVKVCPYRYVICNLANGATCEVKEALYKTTDVEKWKDDANRANSCEYAGNELSYEEYINKSQGKMIKHGDL